MKPSFVTPILERVAREMGVEIHLEPLGYVGVLVRPDGEKRYFRGPSLDLNGLGASEIAKDKGYAAHFLDLFGYPVPEGRAFYTDHWCEMIGSDQNPEVACRYAASEIGWPVIVKPNSKSRGVGVTKVRTKQELLKAVRSFASIDHVFLVQRVILGADYRIVVLDGEVISAYQRLPLSVVGNGVSSVNDLLLFKQQEFERSGRDTTVPIKDPRITATLRSLGMNRGSVISRGTRVALLPNANLSTGGDSIDVTGLLHSEWHRLAAKIAVDMNLRYIGIDIMTEAPLAAPPGKYVVVEINSSAGLDNYSAMGELQKIRVENMFRKVIEAMLR